MHSVNLFLPAAITQRAPEEDLFMKKLILTLMLVAVPAFAQDMTAICEYSIRDFKTRNLQKGDKVRIRYTISQDGTPSQNSISLAKTDKLEIGFMPSYIGSQRLWYTGKSELFVFADAASNLGDVEQTHSTLRVEEPGVAKVEVSCSFLKGSW